MSVDRLRSAFQISESREREYSQCGTGIIPSNVPALLADSVSVQTARIVQEVAMLDYSELIAGLERLPVNQADRSMALAELVAAEANVDRITRVLGWLEDFAVRWGRHRAVTALKSNSFLSA